MSYEDEYYFGIPFKKRVSGTAAKPEPKFKVGDIVRCLKSHEPGRQFTEGNTYRVMEALGGWLRFVSDDKGYGSNGWSDEYFELAPPFTVGDRVKLNRHFGAHAIGDNGDVYAVVATRFGYDVGVAMEPWGVYSVFPAECLEKNAADCPQDNVQQDNVINIELDTSALDEALGKLRALTQPAIVARVLDGQPRPSNIPFVHASIAQATEEAERLAKNNPGQEFAVYQRVGARVASVEYKMKEVA